ncbi:hypothetical protein D3C72_2588650 [compost metagenome]
MHKGDGVTVLKRIQMHVNHAFHFFRQGGQLKVMSGEQGHGLDAAGQIFGAGPGQG